MNHQPVTVFALGALVAIYLVSGLAFPVVASYTAVYVTMVAGLILTGHGVAIDRQILATPYVRLVAIAVGLLSVATVLAGPTSEDWLAPLIVALILVGLGLAALRTRFPKVPFPLIIASLCLIGAALGAAVGVWEVFDGARRARVGDNNPVHYGGLVVIVGFAALAGFETIRSPARYVFFLGPLFAFAGAVASGTRGAMAATLVLGFIAAVLLIWWNRRDRIFWMVMGAILAGLVGGAVYFAADARALAGLISAMEGLIKGEFSELGRRPTLFGAGIDAFFDSPVWGHGYSQLMLAAFNYLPEGQGYERFDHLHNDLIDFAVIGGILGIGAYLCLMAAPLVVLRSWQLPTTRAAILLGVMLSASYVCLGLTNAMIGVLPQTVLFGVLLGAVIAMERSARADGTLS